MSRKKTLENYSKAMFDQGENYDKCAWDISIDKVSMKDRPRVIDYIEHITGLKALCGRNTRERYRLLWVDHDIINGQSYDSRSGVNKYFKHFLEPKGYKLIKLDFNIGEL